nr:helix-turn-helix domain-containing protein [Caldinitratiruptor microaerophilus]
MAARSGLTRTEVLQLIGALVERNLVEFGGGRVWIPPGQASHIAGLLRVWCRSGTETHRIPDCLLDILTDRGPLTLRELADAAGVSYTTVHKVVTALEGEGKVEKAPIVGPGGRVVVRIPGDTRAPAAISSESHKRRWGELRRLAGRIRR